MSHIPSAAMPHAGPTHHDAPPPPKPPAVRAGGWPVAAIAFGSVLALGAVAVAVPLLRQKPKPKRKGKRKPRV